MISLPHGKWKLIEKFLIVLSSHIIHVGGYSEYVTVVYVELCLSTCSVNYVCLQYTVHVNLRPVRTATEPV